MAKKATSERFIYRLGIPSLGRMELASSNSSKDYPNDGSTPTGETSNTYNLAHHRSQYHVVSYQLPIHHQC